MATASTRPFFTALVEDLSALKDAPRELWLVYLVKFLESVAYFAVYNLLNVALTEDFHIADKEAGFITGTWLTAVSVLMFVSGVVTDTMGIRRALLLSVSSCIAGRVVMAAATTPTVAIAGLALSTWGIASMMPTMTAAVRRYTRTETVSFGFSFFYVVMNVGAFVAPITIGALRRTFPSAVTFDLPLFGAVTASSSRIMFAVAAVATLGALVCVLLMRNDEAVVAQPVQATKESPLAVLRELFREPRFRAFMLFVTLLVLVRLIFQHAHQTWPKYTMREFGKEFDWAWYWSLNPLMVMVLTPFVTALTRRWSAFWCIVGGCLVTALSVFPMALSTTPAASLAFVVILSLGEMVWSPRLYEYTATVAQPGREASYMGFSQVPMFFAKMTVGWMSGSMLAAWCPETGERSSHLLWVVIGLTTLAGPVLLVALRRVFERRTETAAVPATA